MAGMIAPLLSLLAAAVGLAVSLVLAAHHAQLAIAGAFCTEGGGCDAVLASKYAKVLGVPLAHLGVGFYAVALGVGLMVLASGTRPWRTALLVLGCAGLLASAMFVGIQAVAIHRFCPLCLTSAASSLVLCAAAVGAYRRASPSRPLLAVGLCALAIPITAAALVLSLGRSSDPVLGKFDGVDIRLSDYQRDIPDALSMADMVGYEARAAYLRQKFESLATAAEMKRRGMTRDELTLDAIRLPEATRRALEEQVDAQAPKNEKARRRIAAEMIRRSPEWNAWLETLVARHQVQTMIRPPAGRKVEVDLSLAHREGPENAPLKLVVFSDLTCSICAQLNGTLEALRGKYGDKLAVYYRHFPLGGHEFAVDAAVVGDCIANSGKDFFSYKRLLYERTEPVDRPAIEAAAKELGLTDDAVAKCLADPDLRARVQKSAAEARALHLGGAPTLILNGRLLSGSIDFGVLDRQLEAQSAP